jgi:hypothetical protein
VVSMQANHRMPASPELLIRCFDFSPPEGWIGIADTLLTDIGQILRDADVPAGVFSVRQVKEKFGGLRVYCDGYPKPPSNPSMEGEWASGMEGDSNRTPPSRTWYFEGVCSVEFAEDVDDALIARLLAAIAESAYVSKAVAASIRARIEEAREEADHTCQLCGAEGGLVVETGWHMTVCEGHRDRAARAAWRKEREGQT